MFTATASQRADRLITEIADMAEEHRDLRHELTVEHDVIERAVIRRAMRDLEQRKVEIEAEIEREINPGHDHSAANRCQYGCLDI